MVIAGVVDVQAVVLGAVDDEITDFEMAGAGDLNVPCDHRRVRRVAGAEENRLRFRAAHVAEVERAAIRSRREQKLIARHRLARRTAKRLQVVGYEV